MGIWESIFGSSEARNQKKVEKIRQDQVNIIELRKKQKEKLDSLKEILIKELKETTIKYGKGAVSKEGYNSWVIGMLTRQNELRKMNDAEGYEYIEIDINGIISEVKNDNVWIHDDNDEDDIEKWKKVPKEIREKLGEKRADHYNKLKEITGQYTNGQISRVEADDILKEWKTKEKKLIKEYNEAKLPYKPIFDYWSKYVKD